MFSTPLEIQQNRFFKMHYEIEQEKPFQNLGVNLTERKPYIKCLHAYEKRKENQKQHQTQSNRTDPETKQIYNKDID